MKELEDDPGKALRIAHLVDNCLYMGEDYFATIQGGLDEKVWGFKVAEYQYHDDGTYTYEIDLEKHPNNNGTIDTTGLACADWQTIGLGQMWRLYTNSKSQALADLVNETQNKINSYEKWTLNYSVKLDDLASVAVELDIFATAQILKFVMGERSFDEWDTYVEEWLDKGGDALLNEYARQMGIQSYR